MVLARDCDMLMLEVVHAHTLSTAIARREHLRPRLDAVEAECSDYDIIVKLGKEFDTAEAEIEARWQSPDELCALRDKHAAFIARVDARCKELVRARDYAALEALAAKLKELKALDVSSLQPRTVKEVQLPPPPASTAAEEEDGMNDPVYVPPAMDETTLN
jgi:DNA repair ATPase RecN